MNTGLWLLACAGCFAGGLFLGGYLIARWYGELMDTGRVGDALLAANCTVALLGMLRRGEAESFWRRGEFELDYRLTLLAEAVERCPRVSGEFDEQVRRVFQRILDYRGQHPAPGLFPPSDEALDYAKRFIAGTCGNQPTEGS
jgi:hypothetical protein